MSKLSKLDDSSIHYGVYAKYIKRILDFTVSGLALLLLSPVLLILCILVRTKLGSPVFFKQVRAGLDEKPFKMVKFRTMTDARDENGNLLRDEERFTRFGDFLRNFSLDELPELLNVLKGDMSIVGPRPLYTYYLPYYTEEEALRHAVRGGITGLAQINGRALCRWNDRFSYDLQYVRNISFTNDIRILWQTVYKVVKKTDIGIPSVTDEGGLHIIRDLQRPSRISEIGSTFSGYIDETWNADYPVALANTSENEHVVFLSSGRSCIREILKHLGLLNKKAIVPAFTCESVVEPFVEAGIEVLPYHLESDLSIDTERLKELIENERPAIIIYHRYFGFDTCRGIEQVLRDYPELITIEDETQYMFSESKSKSADFRIGSIRKWGAVPDGAYLVSREHPIMDQPREEDSEFVYIEIEAMHAKQKFLDGKTEDKRYQKLFADGRKHIDQQHKTYSMSHISNAQAKKLTDCVEVRRSNAQVLVDGLKGFEWFDCPIMTIEKGVTPFYIPILIHENRKDFQQYLASQKIYATVIWGCPEQLKETIDMNDKKVYDEILCIPCDQRYDSFDMQRIVWAIKRYDIKRGSL